MSNIQERIAALSPEQRKLLELRLKQKRINYIPPRKALDTLNLSPMQEGLWLAHQLQPDLPLYNESSLFKLTGKLDIKAVETSINKIIDRHEILRTSFQIVEDKITQVIANKLTISLKAIALEEYSETKREAEIKSLVTYYSQQPFNLEQLPLLRSIIITLSEREHLMLVTMHHIISDGWSWGIFCQELATFYRGLTLPDLAIQYGDFALWYQENIREKTTSQLDYWQQQLKDTPPILELPTDYPRPAKASFKGKREVFIIPPQLTKQLKALSKQENVTTFMLLLAAWQTFLYRYTQQTDILIGTPVANRNNIETENLIGYFINTLVLRSNLDGEPSFLELLQRVKATTLAAYQHQDLPFEELVKELRVERSPGINPLFQVMFVYQEAPLLNFDLPDLTITPLPIDNGIAKFDLTLYLEDTKSELVGFLEYSSDLFTGDTIKRMLANFKTLVTGIIANPNISVSCLSLLTEAETNKLLVEWNDTQKDYPLDICLHQLFEKQVTKTPDAIAVLFKDKHLTYAELNNKANRLAHYLQQNGVKPDVIVGICCDRSLEMVIALLAILKAGGAYLPLDTNLPNKAITFRLQDAQVPIVLTQKHLQTKVETCIAATENNIQVIDLNFTSLPTSPLPNSPTPPLSNNLAYVIYTSGSTGTPKGVMNTHRGICNRLLWMQETYQLTPNDAVLQKTPFSFDVSVWEFFWTLITGARLVVAKPGGHQDSVYLVKTIADHNITTIHFVPSMLQIFLEESGLNHLSSLRRVICSGEALSIALQEKFFAKLNAELHNLYGPTEAAIDVTYWQCQPDTNLNTVPIGRPIANTQIYILDKHLQPLPIGVPGELYIGGIGVAKGYLNRPELTKEKFINNPLITKFNKDKTNLLPLLYKTGDLARYLLTLNGNIEYIGRIDNQVKLRGFRIELGEIEAVLTRHPGVREVVVIVKNKPQSLIAYLVLQQPETSITELRCFLQRQLPEYMIPNAFVVLDALPLTTNGKVNRCALSNIDAVASSKESVYIAPDTPTQEILTGIWSQILNLSQVGIEDNFFELGGHSLLATQVISLVRKTFKVEIPLGELFAAPTITQFSQLIEKAIASKAKLDSLPLKPVARNTNLPLSFAQQRLWLLQQIEPDSAAYNGSNTLLIDGNINLDALIVSIDKIVRRHEILRTSFDLVNGQAVQKIANELKIYLPIIDLQNLSKIEQEAEVKRLTVIDAQKPFDLTQAPLLRLSLIKLKIEKHLLLVTMHHIISDAWSAEIFIKELSALYQAFSTGKSSPLPELSIQYVDFAVWQQEWLQGEILNNQLTYWKQQLENSQTTLELPRDKFSSEITSVGKQYHFTLNRELSQNLETVCQQQGVTLFMTLLTTLNILLYSYSKQEDILIGSPIANRNRSEIEGLIGFFVNTLVLRTNLSNNPTFTELLQRVREVALDAYANQDLPFDKLVAELQPERYRDRSPLFQVWFVLQNAPTAELKLSELNLTLLDIETGLVRHDLKLDLTKTESGIKGFFEYKQDLFSENAIANLIQRFKTISSLIIEQPELKLYELIKVVMDTEKEEHKIKSDRFKQQQILQINKFKRKTVNREYSS